MPDNQSVKKSNNSNALDAQVDDLSREIRGAEDKLKLSRRRTYIVDATDFIEFTNKEDLSIEECHAIISEINDDLIDTSYTPKRMASLVKNCELDIMELRTVTDMIVKYSVKPDSIEKLVLGGIKVYELDGFLDLHMDYNPKISFRTKRVETLDKTDKITDVLSYIIPNAENFMSYDNMLFLRNLVHGGTADQTRSALGDICKIRDDVDLEMGVGVILHRMRNLYESDEKYRNMSLELLTRVALGSDLGMMGIYKSIRAWDDDSEPE